MAPFPLARFLLFALIIAFITGLAFYALTSAGHCPSDRPLRVENGPCVPESWLETTAHRGGGER